MRSPISRTTSAAIVTAVLMAGSLVGCQPAPDAGQASFQPEPPPPPPAVTPDRTLILLINFDFDSHRIRPESYAALDTAAAAMSAPPLAGLNFDVDGHTDIIGRFGYNVALSQLRARAVVNYLVARGVPRAAMHVQGFGPLHLFDPANPAAAVNRRVEITSIR